MRRGFEKQIIAISHFELGMAHPYWLLPGVRPTTTTTSRAEKKNPKNYRKVSNISRTLLGNEIVDHSDVVGASPFVAAPTTSSFST